MITNRKHWNHCVEINKDPYGKACVDVARKVMEILDTEEEFDTHDIICKADKEVEAGGLTGFMAGCVANMVSTCHSRGKEFQTKWNKSYNINPQRTPTKGAVNPAIIEIEEVK